MTFDAERSDLTVGVVGTGAMGRGIMQVAAVGGMRVLACDARSGRRGHDHNGTRSRARPRAHGCRGPMFGLETRRTRMISPATSRAMREAAHRLLGSDGVPVSLIHDSPGFVAPRIVAMIVNIASGIAQQGIGTPADIDRGAQLGLDYPWARSTSPTGSAQAVCCASSRACTLSTAIRGTVRAPG